MIRICIPCRDEDRTIGVLLWKIREVMLGMGRDFHVYVLDDGSRDRTGAQLEKYRQVLPLTILSEQRPIGYGRALEKLLKTAAGGTRYPKRDAIVTMQADFTEHPHPPSRPGQDVRRRGRHRGLRGRGPVREPSTGRSPCPLACPVRAGTPHGGLPGWRSPAGFSGVPRGGGQEGAAGRREPVAHHDGRLGGERRTHEGAGALRPADRAGAAGVAIRYPLAEHASSSFQHGAADSAGEEDFTAGARGSWRGLRWGGVLAAPGARGDSSTGFWAFFCCRRALRRPRKGQ